MIRLSAHIEWACLCRVAVCVNGQSDSLLKLSQRLAYIKWQHRPAQQPTLSRDRQHLLRIEPQQLGSQLCSVGAHFTGVGQEHGLHRHEQASASQYPPARPLRPSYVGQNNHASISGTTMPTNTDMGIRIYLPLRQSCLADDVAGSHLSLRGPSLWREGLYQPATM